MKSIEILCKLHDQCNLRCKFCFETDNGIRVPTPINIDYIKSLPNIIIDSIGNVIRENDIKNINIAFMGGELFSDNIGDEVFDAYRYFIDNLSGKLLEEFNINLVINVVSNGVFTKYDRVEKFITDFNMRLIFSYDATARFNNDQQREMWLKTYKHFRDKGIKLWISTVLSKQNIDAYISGDEMFNNIDPTTFIEFQDYYPRLTYDEYLPNDDDYYNFYKWCIDNGKFNSSFIQDIFNHSDRICNSKYVSYLFDESIMERHNTHYIYKCNGESPMCNDDYYGHEVSSKILTHDCPKYKQPLGLAKRGCLYCEYHGKCPSMCCDLILFKDYQLSECPIRRIYQYIENNPSVMNKYNEWNDKYGERYRNTVFAAYTM